MIHSKTIGCTNRWNGRIHWFLSLCVLGILMLGSWSIADAWNTVVTGEQCNQCLTDSWCQANTSSGAFCGAGLKRCRPADNKCVECLEDSDCGNKRRCTTKNKCVATNCPSTCASDLDCLQASCGAARKCQNQRCVEAVTSLECHPPNLMIILDVSCSMKFTGRSLVDTKQPCRSRSQCRNYMRNLRPTHSPVYYYTCKRSRSLAVKTCHFTRWDVAVSSLKRVVQDYGGTKGSSYADRKIRFGLTLFSSYGKIAAPIYRNPDRLIQILNATRPGGGTRYDRAFYKVKRHFQYVLPNDSVEQRITATLFLTDGAPNEGCYASPPIVKSIYNMRDKNNKPRNIRSYIVGFGSGLSSSGERCLSKLATAGHTDEKKCNSGRCLTFYAADTADALSDAFQDIINQTTKELCDGLDNDCDGKIDNTLDGSCNCRKSYTKPTSSFPDNRGTTFEKGVRLYTYLSSFGIQGDCPSQADQAKALAYYNQSCRNRVSEATSCSPSKESMPQPKGNAYGYYCRRCCGDGVKTNTCSWPVDHACERQNWSRTSLGACVNDCVSWCKNNRVKAANCNMPRGILRRSGSGSDGSQKLTILASIDFGEDVLNKQPNRWLFVNLPGKDHRSTSAESRPLIADVQPDSFEFPSHLKLAWSATSMASWGTDNYLFSVGNPQLTAALIGIESTLCTGADCKKDRDNTIRLILGYHETTGVSYRTHRLGAIEHSSPTVIGPPKENRKDTTYLRWLRTPIKAGGFSRTIQQRPSVVYVGSNDGIMHAFHAETGAELWGFIPKTILHKIREVTNGVGPKGGRVYTVDGTPVVQNVQMYRYVDPRTSSVVSKWRTVLLFGLRSGGKGYIAIDVSNPYQPRLLWEINNQSDKDPADSSKGTFDRMSYTYGKPLIANVLINWKGRLQERAVAILPGGVGLNQKNSSIVLNRTDPRQGGVVYIVDLESGTLIKEILPIDPSKGIFASRARGIAAGPVGYAIQPSIATRVFVGDVLGRLFRIDLTDHDPSQWKTTLFFNLFGANEVPMPIMAAPTIAFNRRGELVLFGGTGNIQNVNSVTGVNKIFSLREVLEITNTSFLVKAVPNFVAPLNKYLPNEFGTQPGREVSLTSATGEKVTGSPVIFKGLAYFHTYIPSPALPVCGVPGHARLYGVHFDEACRSQNCVNALMSRETVHYYHKVLGYVKPAQNPLKCCDTDGICNSSLEDPPTDDAYAANPKLCGDLHYTVPMLQDRVTKEPYQYHRYRGIGPNTMSMGVHLAFQPGLLQISRIVQNSTFAGHSIVNKSAGSFFLSMQVAGRDPSSDPNFSLKAMRAILPSTDAQLSKGNFVGLTSVSTTIPLLVTSWGSLLN